MQGIFFTWSLVKSWSHCIKVLYRKKAEISKKIYSLDNLLYNRKITVTKNDYAEEYYDAACVNKS